MKQQVFYVHGGDSFNAHDDFINYLRTKNIRDLPTSEPFVKWTHSFSHDLGEDYEVFMPQMPNAQNAKYEEWKIWFERHFEYLHDGVIFLGCSLGAMFLLKYFSENETKFHIKAIFIMAGVVGGLDLNEDDCGDFLSQPESLSAVSKSAETILVLHSKDDFLVPYEHGVRISQAIPESTLITYEDKNHFLIERFPELIAEIKKIA